MAPLATEEGPSNWAKGGHTSELASFVAPLATEEGHQIGPKGAISEVALFDETLGKTTKSRKGANSASAIGEGVADAHLDRF